MLPCSFRDLRTEPWCAQCHRYLSPSTCAGAKVTSRLSSFIKCLLLLIDFVLFIVLFIGFIYRDSIKSLLLRIKTIMLKANFATFKAQRLWIDIRSTVLKFGVRTKENPDLLGSIGDKILADCLCVCVFCGKCKKINATDRWSFGIQFLLPNRAGLNLFNISC